MSQQSNPIISSSMAYVVTYDSNKHIAFAPSASKEFIDCPKTILKVPQSADYAYGMIEWRENWMPLIDMRAFLNTTDEPLHHSPPFCLILAYMPDNSSSLSFGAIALHHVPKAEYVTDQDFHTLPNDNRLWSKIAMSCFLYQNTPVPIISVSKLFQHVNTITTLA